MSITSFNSSFHGIKYSGNTSQLDWLIRLRWVAIASQSILLFLALNYFHLTLQAYPLWIIVFLTGISNAGLLLFRQFLNTHSGLIVAGVLIFDTIALTGLLAYSGGPTNPFSIVFLAHVSIAALLLGPKWTWTMVVLSTVCFALLFQFHVAVPELAMHHHDAADAFSTHLQGMLLSFVLVALMLGFFLARMAQNAMRQERQIGDLKIMTAYQEKLTALTTLAAGAAHELNSPLNTILILTEELQRALKEEKLSHAVSEDVETIAGEVERCRTIIERMGNNVGERIHESSTTIDKWSLIKDLKGQIESENVNRLHIDLPDDFKIVAPKKSLIESLVTLIRNGFEAGNAQSVVSLHAATNKGMVSFLVSDNGSGISKEILPRIGEPFFTTKEPGKGMGLGIFLVKLFTLQISGALNFDSNDNRGTVVTLTIPQIV